MKKGELQQSRLERTMEVATVETVLKSGIGLDAAVKMCLKQKRHRLELWLGKEVYDLQFIPLLGPGELEAKAKDEE